MSRKIQARIPHGEIWDDFRETVTKKYNGQFNIIGLELETAMRSYLEKENHPDYIKSESEKTQSEDTSENKSVFIFSEPVFKNKNRKKLYEFLKQHDAGSKVNFNAIKHFVHIRLGKTGRRTPHEYADAMVDSEVIEPIQLNSKGKSAYKQYRILIGISKDGKTLDKLPVTLEEDIF